MGKNKQKHSDSLKKVELTDKDQAARAHGKGSGKRKLNAEQLAIAIKMLGAWYKLQEIVDFMRDEHKISITKSAICQYQKSHAKDIERARTEFMSNVEALPVTQKAYRIKLRQDLANDLLKENNLWGEVAVVREGRIQINADGEPKTIRVNPNHLAVNKILDSVNEELEPKRHEITGKDGKAIPVEIFDKALEKVYGGH